MSKGKMRGGHNRPTAKRGRQRCGACDGKGHKWGSGCPTCHGKGFVG